MLNLLIENSEVIKKKNAGVSGFSTDELVSKC